MNRTLRYSSKGDDVSKLQQGLNQLASALPSLNVDGIFGTKTAGRVKEFQRTSNLVSDGIVGPHTWQVLLQILPLILNPPVQPNNQPPNPLRALVLYYANSELSKPVHWAKYESRILEYFKYSTGKTYTKHSALTISWCSYFVHWCLWRANASPIPRIGGSIPRFLKSRGGVYEDYPVFLNKYVPKPGDMYYRPIPNNHIGFISDVRSAGKGYEIRSIDGNSGPKYFHPYFDISEGRKIGYGFIYQPPVWRKLTNQDFYIKLCDG
jgi:peptidoglycan hydrolase-like protein with peptidoglycan-binding domain